MTLRDHPRRQVIDARCTEITRPVDPFNLGLDHTPSIDQTANVRLMHDAHLRISAEFARGLIAGGWPIVMIDEPRPMDPGGAGRPVEGS